jgi:muconolactone delta-isomerase
MRFLVISKSKHLLPPEVSAGLIDAMGPWRSKYADKLEQVWGFAGVQGGGGIVNVSSLEELDALMAEFPMQATSDIQIIPLVDLDSALRHAKQAVAAVTVGVN